MEKTMKRLMKTGPKTTTLVDVPVPTLPNEDCVLVKLKYCGVCMSEHYDWSADIPARSFGHEPIGVVVEVGKNVTALKVGDRVSGGGFGGGVRRISVRRRQRKAERRLRDPWHGYRHGHRAGRQDL